MAKKQREDIVVLRVKKTAYQKAAENWQFSRTPQETSARLIEWIAVCETQTELDSIWLHLTKAREKDAFHRRMAEIKEREKAKRKFLSLVPE